MRNLSFRTANIDDVDALVACDSVAGHDRTRIDAIHRWVREGVCHVGLLDNQMVGYGVVTHDFFEQSFIQMLMIAPTSRRSGVGRHLLRHLCSLGKTAKLWSSTNQSNVSMQALFEAEGFVKSGLIENMDEDDPELIYLKLLGGAEVQSAK